MAATHSEHHLYQHHNCTAIIQADCLCDPTPQQQQYQLHQQQVYQHRSDNVERSNNGNPHHHICPDPLFPQISHLQQLDYENPDAKFVLLTRKGREWAESVAAHVGGWEDALAELTIKRSGTSMLERLKAGDIPGLPPGSPRSSGRLIQWQREHYANVQNYFNGRDGKLFQLDIAAGVTATQAEELAVFLGFPKAYGSLWGKHLHANQRGYYSVAGRRSSKDDHDSNGNGNAANATASANPANVKSNSNRKTLTSSKPFSNEEAATDGKGGDEGRANEEEGEKDERVANNNRGRGNTVETNMGEHGIDAEVEASAIITDNLIPKIVWLYWSQGVQALQSARLEYRRCHASWVENNRGWDVRVVSADTLHDYIDAGQAARVLAVRSLQAQSDLARLLLLARHGGVYVDADVYSVVPLNRWLPQLVQPSGAFLFSMVGRDRLVATWFIAAVQGSPLIEAWAAATEDFFITHDYTFGKYLQVHYIFTSVVQPTGMANATEVDATDSATANDDVDEVEAAELSAAAAAAAAVWAKMPRINATTGAADPCCTAMLPSPRFFSNGWRNTLPQPQQRNPATPRSTRKNADRMHTQKQKDSNLQIRNKVFNAFTDQDHENINSILNVDGSAGPGRLGGDLHGVADADSAHNHNRNHKLNIKHKVLKRDPWLGDDERQDVEEEQVHEEHDGVDDDGGHGGVGGIDQGRRDRLLRVQRGGGGDVAGRSGHAVLANKASNAYTVLPRVAVRALDGGFCAPWSLEASIMFASGLVPVVKGKAKLLHGRESCPTVHDHSNLSAVPPPQSILAELDAFRAAALMVVRSYES